MEFLKDKKILSKDKKVLSMDKNFLSFNFIHQYHLYLQCDMQNWRITFPSMDKKFLSFNIILQFYILHCKYRWSWWIKLKDKFFYPWIRFFYLWIRFFYLSKIPWMAFFSVMWNLILHYYPWIKSIDKSEGWQTWPEPIYVAQISTDTGRSFLISLLLTGWPKGIT